MTVVDPYDPRTNLTSEETVRITILPVSKQIFSKLDAKNESASSKSETFILAEKFGNLTAKIAYITDKGVIQLAFSDKLLPFNFTNVTNDQMDIRLITSYPLDEEPTADLNFDWNIIKVHENLVDIQLNFTKPTDVSIKLSQDSIQIRVKDRLMFKSADGTKVLSGDSIMLTKRIPR